MIAVREGDPHKVLVIMRGLPGSGKTTAAAILSNTQFGGKGKIFSTDDFFIDESKNYVFDPTKLAVAHAWNRGRVRQSMSESFSPIFVDNVFSQAWEMKSYYELAITYNYSIRIAVPSTRWRWDPDVCVTKTTKGVGIHAMMRILRRWDRDVTFQHVMSQETPAERRPGYLVPNSERHKDRYKPIPQPDFKLPTADETEEDAIKKYRAKYGKAPNTY